MFTFMVCLVSFGGWLVWMIYFAIWFTLLACGVGAFDLGVVLGVGFVMVGFLLVVLCLVLVLSFGLCVTV